jgi:predicted permease
MRVLLRIASRHATAEELGDVMEDYAAARRAGVRGKFWFVSQIISILRRRRSHLTTTERWAEMISNLLIDIRYALRTFARNPGFAFAAIVPIALGIGINTGIFSVLNSAAWRALPVPGSDALVSVYQDFRGGPRRRVQGARAMFSIPEYRAYRDQSHTLSGLMGYSRETTMTLGGESPQEIGGILVTCNYFDVLGLKPALGAGFTAANCGTPGASDAVVLSHAFWQRAFSGDPRILERSIVLNGRDVTVVGVAPPGFDGVAMSKVEFFAPTSMEEQSLHENPHVSWLSLMGRRRDDASVAQVRADLSVIAGRIDREQQGRATSLIVEPAAALSLPPARQAILRGAGIVMAAFGFVLLIAAANVANMLLARAAGRTREIAIRLSSGASRGRLVQQLLTESAVIAIAGAASGFLLFWWSFEALIPWLLSSFPDGQGFKIDATPDATVLWFALGLTAATALAFGLVPALQASKCDVHTVMKQDGMDARGGRGRLRGILIGAQVALCTMLLIPSALLSRALYAAHTFDPGFDDRNVAAVTIDLRGPRYEKGNAAIFNAQWLERVKALPGVERVSEVGRMPLTPGRTQGTFRLADDPNADEHLVDVNRVSPEFFALLGMPIVRGRAFTDGELNVAMVTESTARRFWPGKDALGRVITTGNDRRHIIGIVRDAKISQAQEAVSTYFFLPIPPGSQRRVSVLAKTRGDFESFAASVRAETSRLDPGLIVNVRPLSDNLGLLQTLSTIMASVAGMLSLLAVGLGAIGVYGVVAYVVSRRRREVGVRMALGAAGRDVQWMILRQTLRPVVIGMFIGIAIAAVTARLLQAVLFGVSPHDPLAFIGGPLLMLAIAAAAALIPTRRAMQVNPISVLRSE